MKDAVLTGICDDDLVECKRNSARILPSFCARYRNGAGGAFGWPAACAVGCEQIEEMDRLAALPPAIRQAEVRRAKALPMIEEVTPVASEKMESKAAQPKEKRVCPDCGRLMPMAGRGLCGKCYYVARQRDAGKEVVAKVAVMIPQSSEPVLLDRLPSDPPVLGPASSSFETQLDIVLADLRAMLLAKNAAYGDSARNPVRCFSKAAPAEAIRVRIDDKISRLMRGDDAGEDTTLDLLGYLILLRTVEVAPC